MAELESVKELTGLVVALGCLVYLLVRYIPMKDERFANALAIQGELFKVELARVVEAARLDHAESLVAITRLTTALERLEQRLERVLEKNNNFN